MMRMLYANIDGQWAKAEWAGGKGGRYVPLEGEALEWLRYVLADGRFSQDVMYLLAEDDGDWIAAGNIVPLEPASKRYKNKVLTVTPPSGRSIEFQHDNDGWLDSLAKSSKVPLAVAVVDDVPTLVWLNDGGYDGWRNERAEADHARQLGKKHTSGEFFINPYSFVPLPERMHRARPRGHACLAPDGLSGWFNWVLTMRTELLLAADQPGLDDQLLSYPGSSLRGALRSLHEAMAGGCMRILDDSYVPVHREPMNAYRDGKDQLAVVRAIDPITHAVTSVEVAKRTCWVELGVLQGAAPQGPLHSGKECSVNPSHIVHSAASKRYEVRVPGSVTQGTGWMMHITDANARQDGHQYLAAVGEFTGDPQNLRPISASTWTRFVKACEGSGDMVGVHGAPDTAMTSPGQGDWPGVNVRHRGVHVGRRRKVDGWLAVGDTVWLSADGDLKMAAIWRRHGRHSVADRMDSAFLPCKDPKDLCPTCAVFGSIRADRSDDHEQAGYRTHVHVGWAVSSETVRSVERCLPPLRAPKPSAGGFYLEAPSAKDGSASTDPGHEVAAHWREKEERKGGPGLRRVRGRKFYWHGQQPGGRQVAQEHNATQHNRAMAIPAGTVLRARVTFDNLDMEQLGWLLAAAQPSTLLGGEAFVHIGGGKPLGYGTAHPEIEDLHVFDAASRYGTGTSPVTQAQAIASIAGLVDRRGLAQVHQALRRLLGPDTVSADRLSYPTTEPFSAQGGTEFDASFKWFAKHSGGRYGDLVPLPDATDRDPFLRGAGQ